MVKSLSILSMYFYDLTYKLIINHHKKMCIRATLFAKEFKEEDAVYKTAIIFAKQHKERFQKLKAKKITYHGGI